MLQVMVAGRKSSVLIWKSTERRMRGAHSHREGHRRRVKKLQHLEPSELNEKYTGAQNMTHCTREITSAEEETL